MSQSHKKSARVVLSAVMVSFAIILFQNCGKKGATVTSNGDGSSTGTNDGNNPPPSRWDAIEFFIKTDAGLSSAPVTSALDPEKTYYFQAKNMDLNGYACAEIESFNSGECANKTIPIVKSDWTADSQSNSIFKREQPSLWIYGETAKIYLKQSASDEARIFSYRVKSPSELVSTTRTYFWSSSDAAGVSRVRQVDTNSENSVFSQVINMGSDQDQISVCQEVYLKDTGNIRDVACVDADGKRVNSVQWITKALYNSADRTKGLFKNKVTNSNGVIRYYNEDIIKDWYTNDLSCVKTFVQKGSAIFITSINVNDGICP